ncbi:MAG: flagellar basal body-associated FliL family protein [Burkholderiaceae bacterium]
MSADQAPAEGAQAPKKSKKLLFIALGVVLLAGGGGGGAWFFMKGKAPAHAEGAEASAAAPKKEEKKPIFVPLEPFTVNLQDARGERYAQIGVTLQVEDPLVENAIKDKLPAVRNGILLLISSKTIDDLLTPEGKQKLALQVGVRSAQAIGTDITDADVQPAAAPVAAAVPASAPVDIPPGMQLIPVAAKVRKSPDNPVKNVLFSQFIVQ